MNAPTEQLYCVQVCILHWHRADGWQLQTFNTNVPIEIGEATDRVQFWREGSQDGTPTRALAVQIEMGIPINVQFEEPECA